MNIDGIENVPQHHNLIQMVGQQLPQGVNSYGSGGNSRFNPSIEYTKTPNASEIVNLKSNKMNVPYFENNRAS